MSAAVVRVPSGLSVDGWSAASYRGLWEVKKRFLPQCAARDDAPFKFPSSSILSIVRVHDELSNLDPYHGAGWRPDGVRGSGHLRTGGDRGASGSKASSRDGGRCKGGPRGDAQ